MRASDETRRRLLTAAAAKVRTSGYRGASVDAILGPAGLTKGAFYHHFDSKEALGRLLVERFWTELRPLLESCEPTPSAMLACAASDAGLAIADLCGEYGEGMEGLRESLVKVLGEWKGTLAARLGEQGAEPLLAASLGGALLAKVLQDPALPARVAPSVSAPSDARAEGLSYID